MRKEISIRDFKLLPVQREMTNLLEHKPIP